MTDKLIEQLRDEDSYYRIQEKHWCIDAEELERQRLAAADRIETLTAENERLREAMRDAIGEIETGAPLTGSDILSAALAGDSHDQ